MDKKFPQQKTASGASRTVSCPVHHLPITIEKMDGKEIAKCACKVPHNQYAGRVVWERADTRRVV